MCWLVTRLRWEHTIVIGNIIIYKKASLAKRMGNDLKLNYFKNVNFISINR